MNIHMECENALASIRREIEVSAARAAIEIEFSFRKARTQMDYRHDARVTGWVIGGGGFTSVGLICADGRHAKAFELRRNGDVLFSDNPLYINVPAIIGIWLRSTTLYRVLRVIWLGERA